VRVTVKVTPWQALGADEESVTRPAMDCIPLVVFAPTVTAGEKL
jgi:hypothetical protein